MKVFIDANIFLDRFDSSRRFHKSSILAYGYLIYNAKLFTIFLIRRYKQPNYFIRQVKMALKLIISRKIALEFQTL